MKLNLTTPSNILDDLCSVVVEEVRKVIPVDQSKKIIVYGAGARGAIIHSALKSFNRKISYFIDSDVNKHNTLIWRIPIYSPEKIKCEDLKNVFVIVAADYPIEMIQRLESYGLIDKISIAPVFDRFSIYEGTPYTTPLPLLDPILGFNRESDIPGFKILGSESNINGNKKPLRIVILGNSTTDPGVADPVEWRDINNRSSSFGSWPKHLHELLLSKGVSNTIFNGAVSAYSSAQETLKLFRDCLELSPDLIISFDGINDTGFTYWHKQRYPKSHSHFKKIENAIKPFIDSGQINIPTIESTSVMSEFFFGIETKRSPVEEWYSNHRIMNAICREFGIGYISFLQPGGLYLTSYMKSCDVRIRIHWLLVNLFISWLHIAGAYEYENKGGSLADLGIRELLEYYLKVIFAYNSEKKSFDDGKDDQIEKFYKDAKIIAAQSKYIVDISEILYGKPDVFYDGCHCTTKGNKIIAEKVFNVLAERKILPIHNCC